jgi:hypothetical protein
VPLPAGAREVELWVADGAYRLGKLVTLLTLALVAGVVVWGAIEGRRRTVARA